MKAVMLSIRPEWCEKIISGEKTIEVRKTRPKLETPFKCYIYCTGVKNKSLTYWMEPRYHYCDDHSHNAFDRIGNGAVIGEFICDRISPIAFMYYDGLVDFVDCKTSCLSAKEILDYAGGQRLLYGWHISNLVIYDKPKKLSEFTGIKNTRFGGMPYKIQRPPQSWCYVEVLE